MEDKSGNTGWHEKSMWDGNWFSCKTKKSPLQIDDELLSWWEKLDVYEGQAEKMCRFNHELASENNTVHDW